LRLSKRLSKALFDWSTENEATRQAARMHLLPRNLVAWDLRDEYELTEQSELWEQAIKMKEEGNVQRSAVETET